MPNFDIPLSGLNADSTALNTIANNLSNMNTTAFKAQTTNFSDLFYQQVGTTGSGDEIQQGTGVQVASNTTDFTGGTISSNGISTNAAIDGAGFFVLDNGNGSQLYTRDGDFQLSSNGTLESTSGQAVMGYSATNGVINTSSALSDIVIPTGGVMAPSATTTFSVTQNLDSAGTTASSPVTVYDSLGNSYVATVNYTKTGTNEWSYSISMPDKLTPASTTTGGTTTINYDFGASGGTLATVNTGSSLTITAPATAGGTATTSLPTFTGSPETVSDYVTDLDTALTAAVLNYFPQDADFDGIVFSSMIHVADGSSPEAVEFFLPFRVMRCFASYDCTGQQLLDSGTIVINGERAALDLQIAEGKN